MKLSKLIADIGVKVAGDSDIASSLDPLSSLDHVRKLAYTNNYEDIDVGYPLLAMDNLDPNSTLLYEHPEKHLRIKAGRLDFSELGGLCLLGGGMLETKRTCLPVTVLYSKTEKVVALHSGNTEMSILESEIYDYSFDKQQKWESQVLSETELQDNLARQRESTVASRNIGMNKIPKCFISDNNLSCCREGILPFLSLRCFQNKGEYDMVNTAVRRMLRVVPPVNDDDVLSTKWPRVPISFYSFWETSSSVGKRNDATEEVVGNITNRPILASLAYAVLQYANAANTTDERGENISEWNCTAPFSSSHTEVVHSFQQHEKNQMDEFKKVSVTDLWEHNTSDKFHGHSSRRSVSHSSYYSLKDALKDMGRKHSTTLLCDLTTVNQLDVGQHVAQAVVAAIFKEGHDKDAMQYFNCLPQKPFTAFSSICKLAKCLDEKQAFLVVDREEDGRLGRVVLASAGDDIENVNRQSFSRIACLFPWARVLIVDKSKVSLLCVKEPDYLTSWREFAEEYMLVRKELLGLDEVVGLEGTCVSDKADEGQVTLADNAADNAADITNVLKSVRESMQDFKCSNESLVAKNATFEDSIKQLSAKIDVLSENISSVVTIVSEQNAAREEKNTASTAMANEAKIQNCTISKTISIFERLVSATEFLHKRLRTEIGSTEDSR